MSADGGERDVKARPKIYVAVMIGPDMSGKTTFSKMVSKHFNGNFPNFFMTHLCFNKCSSDEIIYQLKNCAVESLGELKLPDRRKLIIVDTNNMLDSENRFNIFSFCLKFDIIYLQIYMEFDREELISRCASRGLFVNPRTLHNPELYNISCIGSDAALQWQNNSITIFKTFRQDGMGQITRLYNFLLNCVPPSQNNVWKNYVPKGPLEFNNPHQLQMQAGISYKDKLMHGTSSGQTKKP